MLEHDECFLFYKYEQHVGVEWNVFTSIVDCIMHLWMFYVQCILLFIFMGLRLPDKMIAVPLGRVLSSWRGRDNILGYFLVEWFHLGIWYVSLADGKIHMLAHLVSCLNPIVYMYVSLWGIKVARGIQIL